MRLGRGRRTRTRAHTRIHAHTHNAHHQGVGGNSLRLLPCRFGQRFCLLYSRAAPAGLELKGNECSRKLLRGTNACLRNSDQRLRRARGEMPPWGDTVGKACARDWD